MNRDTRDVRHSRRDVVAVGGNEADQNPIGPGLETLRVRGDLPSIVSDIDALAEGRNKGLVALRKVIRDLGRGRAVQGELDRSGHLSSTAAPNPKRPNSFPLYKRKTFPSALNACG